MRSPGVFSLVKNHRTTSTTDRSGRESLVPLVPLEEHASSAFKLAGAVLLASLFVPIGLGTLVDWSWLLGIALVGVEVVAAALGLLGLHHRARVDSPWLAIAGATFAAAIAGVAVLALSGLTGVAMSVPGVEFSLGKQAFVLLALTMAAGYGLGFLAFGVGTLRSSSAAGRTGPLLTAGGLLLLVPVAGGVLQIGLGIAMLAWIVFPVLGLVAVDTVAVGMSLRSTS